MSTLEAYALATGIGRGLAWLSVFLAYMGWVRRRRIHDDPIPFKKLAAASAALWLVTAVVRGQLT